MAAITSKAAIDLLKVWGIDTKNLVSADIHFRLDDAVRMDLEYLVDVKNEKKFKTRLEKYYVVKKKNVNVGKLTMTLDGNDLVRRIKKIIKGET